MARRWEMIQQKVQMTPEQASQLKPSYEQYMKDERAAMKTNRENFLALLTPEQREQARQNREDRMTARKNRRQQQPGPEASPAPEARKPHARIQLTDTQKAQIKDLRQKNLAQAKARREQFVSQASGVLSAEQVTRLREALEPKRTHSRKQHGRTKRQDAQVAPTEPTH